MNQKLLALNRQSSYLQQASPVKGWEKEAYRTHWRTALYMMTMQCSFFRGRTLTQSKVLFMEEFIWKS